MNIETDFILGLALGVEFIPADEDAGIDHSCFIIDLLVVRIVVELTGE